MENTFKDVVTIPRKEYDELLQKVAVYNYNRRQLENDIKQGRYVPVAERALYNLPFQEETDRGALERIRARLEKELEESGV